MTAVVLRGDARRLPLPDATVDLICTSPPYFGLRSYTDGGEHYAGQIGSEATPGEWLAALLDCTREWIRVLKPEGSLFVNLGDKYSSGAGAHTGEKSAALRSGKHGHGGGTKWPTTPRQPAAAGYAPKSLLGLPWRYALACTDDLGLILRRDIIWAKPNGLPESVTDRCRTAHEYVFHLVKQPRYYAAVDEIREPQTGPTFKGRAGVNLNGYAPPQKDGLARGPVVMKDREYNPLGKLPGSVWDIPSQPLTIPEWLGVDHFAAYPMELPRRIILGWSPPGICLECGEGRRPVANYERLDIRPGYSKTHNGQRDGIPQSGGTKWKTKGQTDVTITGYACACPKPDAPTRPAIVLDPFGGTGTTALVAAAYGRTGITVDLSGDYCRAARWRTRDPRERASALLVPKPPPVPPGQGELFDPGELAAPP